MSKSLFFVLLFALLNSCKEAKNNYSASTHVKPGQIGLVAKKQKIELGQLSKAEKDTAHFQFILTNKSNSMTVINNIDVSCGCVSIPYKAKPIHPKESIALQGVINLKKQFGHLSKAIFVNYGKGQLLTLRVTADVK